MLIFNEIVIFNFLFIYLFINWIRKYLPPGVFLLDPYLKTAGTNYVPVLNPPMFPPLVISYHEFVFILVYMYSERNTSLHVN